MRRLMRFGSALCVVGCLGVTTAQALNGLVSPTLTASPPPTVAVQYDGPLQGGGYGPPPGYDGGGGPGAYADQRLNGHRHGVRATGSFTRYHGFRIDLSEAQGTIDVPSALAEVEHQIDIVDRAGLSPAMLHTFESFPIHITASFVGRGSHYSGGSEVYLGSLAANDDRPVLLHEYMHVLHFRRMPGGVHNPDVRRFYEEAMARNLYTAGSYMLSNPAEFFAMTASCYLHGTVARPPYDRATIQAQQPEYYNYLAHLFGRGGTAAVDPSPALMAGLH